MNNLRIVFALFALVAIKNSVWGNDLPPGTEQFAMVHIPIPPVMMLPGMKPFPRSGPETARSLPQPLIRDVINAPNPFDSRKAGLEGQTQIAYRLDQDVSVTVTIYDLFGNRVRRWQFMAGQNGGQEGINHFLWDGTNESGQKVAKGGYLAQFELEISGTSASVIRKIGVIH